MSLPTPLYSLTIEMAAEGLAKGEYTSLELTEAYIAHIEKLEPHLNVLVTFTPEIARAQAKESDARRASGEVRGLLDGIPYTLKDVFATTDSPTTASSHMLEGWVAPYNATTYTNLCEAGAVMLGKANTDEFTMGVSTETSYFGVSKNPWDVTKVPGGSSGGAAAAMSARYGLFSIGTDTGGSIRQPAAFCGVFGLKPTYGRVSRFGELPMASSLDQTGPITITAADAAIVLNTLAGVDPLDATSSPEPVPDYLAEVKTLKKEKPLTGLRIGIPKEYFGEGVRPEVEQLTHEAITVLKNLGATTKEISLPAVPYSLAAYYIINPAEVSSNMARYDGIRFGHSIEREEPSATHSLYDIYAKSRAHGLGPEVKRRIMLGTHALSSGYYDAYYGQAESVRTIVRQQFADAFKEVDILAAPVTPHPAFGIGEKVSDPLAMYKEDVLACPVNIAGVPGLSVPCGFIDGLPIGLQLIAANYDEARLLRTAAAYQSAVNFHTLLPPVLSVNTTV